MCIRDSASINVADNLEAYIAIQAFNGFGESPFSNEIMIPGSGGSGTTCCTAPYQNFCINPGSGQQNICQSFQNTSQQVVQLNAQINALQQQLAAAEEARAEWQTKATHPNGVLWRKIARMPKEVDAQRRSYCRHWNACAGVVASLWQSCLGQTFPGVISTQCLDDPPN